ncbi:phage tail protein [Pseudomonas sp. CCI3.2]|uniref:phage tail protein n=1 Tax=unclassified Pseudomonas TaxID=196821 RepID=UPI002B22E653|nr:MULTISPECIES: phage tail protein [unclassified Pseudomonas]MEB0078001.1 phage tail protein [Pseudomonas sp. MH10out]MEB0104327.1 phage tail protein [Pseudomonas sp. CCI3.2]MEB0133516.1 phage tail protein [Pseudomonas sp. CCI2.4]MEB0167946.1 phage tail protein [Pseudomonas sp. CCC4.4]
MNDLNHYVGGDLSLTPTGSLSLAFGMERGKQRILRRLITNPGDYLFHTDYGAGLGRYVGALINIPEVIALIRGQILLESCVARTPAPVIRVSAQNDTLAVSISYTDAPLGEPVTLSFEVNR